MSERQQKINCLNTDYLRQVLGDVFIVYFIVYFTGFLVGYLKLYEIEGFFSVTNFLSGVLGFLIVALCLKGERIKHLILVTSFLCVLGVIENLLLKNYMGLLMSILLTFTAMLTAYSFVKIFEKLGYSK